MSIAIMASVWEHSEQNGTALLMLLAIADNANEYGEAWPSVPTLARKCRMQVRNAQLLLNQLAQAGELRIDVQGGYRTPRGATNMYTIVTPAAHSREGVQSIAPVQPTTPDATHYTRRGAIHGSQGVQPTTPKPSVNHQGNRQVKQLQPLKQNGDENGDEMTDEEANARAAELLERFRKGPSRG
jgi:hypothetical protein